jgi:flagellin
LAIQAASDNFSEFEREMLNTEFQELSKEIDRVAQTTSFGRTKLLNGDTKEYEFQVGAYKGDEHVIKYVSDTNTSASELNIDGAGLTDQSDALDSLETIDEALKRITEARSKFGAVQSRLDSTINNAGVQIENLSAARSRMADTDIAEGVSEMYRAQALQQYQIQVLAQANQFPQSVIRLIA